MGFVTTAAQLRKTALSLPETSLSDGVFTVRGKRFAAVTDGLVSLSLPSGEAARFTAENRGATPTSGGATIALKDINGQALNFWVRRAWLAKAPKSLAAQVESADSAAPGAVGDLPPSIGKPATRALANAGLTTLARIAKLSDAELLALHGVGPKAIRLLREASK